MNGSDLRVAVRIAEALLMHLKDVLARMELKPGLPGNQQEILGRLENIEGNSGKEMREAEKLLRELALSMKNHRQRLTEGLVKILSAELRRREWGVLCTKAGCGESSMFLWMKNLRCREGGAVGCSHTTDGRRHVHGGRTTLWELSLVSKPDQRFSGD